MPDGFLPWFFYPKSWGTTHENTLEMHTGRSLCLYGRQNILEHSNTTGIKLNTKVALMTL